MCNNIFVSILDELRSSLDKYVSKLPLPVRIVRLGQRQGLIRARIAGANQATGQVLIFLDSHIEVANGWLEPMLSEIASDRTRVILPVVDNVNYKTMGYEDWDVNTTGVRHDPYIGHALVADACSVPVFLYNIPMATG